MTLGERLKATLAVAGITPRHLGGATRVHFVTIYRLMREGSDTSFPLIEQTLTEALDKIDRMLADKTLPIAERLSRTEKTKRLSDLLNKHNR